MPQTAELVARSDAHRDLLPIRGYVPKMRSATPRIRREGVDWSGGVDGAPLELRLTFENPGLSPTAPTPAAVRIAEFGAFLPWRPLTTVAVPAIPPRGRAVVTATAAGFTPSRQRGLDRLRRLRPARFLARALRLRSPLIDLREDTQSVHLAANIDVRVGHRRPVERHLGRFACLRPGCLNLSVFKVGDGRRDRYVVTVAEPPEDWRVDVRPAGDMKRGEEPQLTLSGEWDCAPILGFIAPPPQAQLGRVVFAVERPSAQQQTTVELELEKS